MIRLLLLIVLTLAGLGLLLAVFGDPVTRPGTQAEAPETQSDSAGPAPGDAPTTPDRGTDNAAGAETEAPATLVQATSQTPEQVQRFPGPPLTPSPEYAGSTPPPATLPEGPVMIVTGSRVNMRAGPSTSDAVVSALEGGTAVEALGPTDAGWVHIRTAGGQSGYVSGQFLRMAD